MTNAFFSPEEKWKAGDVVGCYVDLDKKYMRWSLNGTKLGICYCNFPTEGKPLYPALSIDTEESCCLNFGGKPFVYPVDEQEEVEAWHEFTSAMLGQEDVKVPDEEEISSAEEEDEDEDKNEDEDEEDEEADDEREARGPDFTF